MPGYTGGTFKNPTYYDVAGGKTGHAESIKIDFNPLIISFRDLLEIFFSTHDPTQLNRQGHDTGPEYRSVIFYVSEEQKIQAQQFIQELTKAGTFDKPIVTALEPLTDFYPAEQEHVDFASKNPNSPYCAYVINPKLDKFKKKYSTILK
jgi:peptide-methionine (S)-S-oxide reductase